ncbi:MAG: transposase [Thermoplasmata archaeon]|nr:transposase [Thermoplasmata archaeon]
MYEDGLDDDRVERGRALSQIPGAVTETELNVFAVKAQSKGGYYRVEIEGYFGQCECEDFTSRGGKTCKHLLAVRFFLEKRATGKHADTPAEIPKRRYSEQWRASDQAQTNEYPLFGKLAAGLAATVPEPPYRTGRPPISIRDGLFCALQREYLGKSLRRAGSHYEISLERDLIRRVPGYCHVSKLLNRPELTPILQELITKSALPFISIDRGFAPDSTGIRTTSFGEWMAEKHDDDREHHWLKLHAIIGTKSHIVASVVIGEKNSADSPQFDALVRGLLTGGFHPDEIYADKGYLAHSNFELAEELGIELFVPFKSNSKPRSTTRVANSAGQKSHSKLWTRSYWFYQEHRTEWEGKYHQRSNVEAVFSSIKRKFGETLRSRTPTAQVNELLCKVLAYNITRVIQGSFEFGSKIDFGPSVAALGEDGRGASASP